MRTTGQLLLLLLLFTACVEIHDHKGKTPLVQIYDEILYREDLATVIPSNLSMDDSLSFAENYIHNWIEDVLMYDLADLNIPDNDRINRLTENYRRALIVYTYQQELINQRLLEEITEQELLDYYEENKEAFVLEQPLVKGLYIKVPKTSLDINKVRRWYKENTHDNVEALEKYSLNKAVSYDYFYDKWMLVSDVMEKMPLQVSDLNNYLRNNRHIEINHGDYYYFLHVEDLLEAGMQKPFEFAKKEIKEMMLNMKRVSFIKDLKSELYRNAVNGKKITYY